MITINTTTCPKCSGKLKYYDKVRRLLRTKNHKAYYIELRRMKCSVCGSLHRELPDNIYPYKQYEAEIISGVLDGCITSDTLGFEDYPCEQTMLNWISQKKHTIL